MRREEAHKVLAKGNDSAEQIKLEKIAAAIAASNSFKGIVDEWLVKVERKGCFAVSMKKLRWLLDFINEYIGSVPSPPSPRRCFLSCSARWRAKAATRRPSAMLRRTFAAR